MFGRADACRHVELVPVDIQALADRIETEAGDLLDQVILQRVLPPERHEIPFREGRKAEFDDPVAVLRVGIVDGVAIAVEELPFPVDDPLERIAEILDRILIKDRLDQGRRLEVRRNPLHEKQVFPPFVGFLVALADVGKRQRILRVVFLYAERNDIGMVHLVERSQFELSDLPEVLAGQLVNRRSPPVLTAEHVLSGNIHPLIGETALLAGEALHGAQMVRPLGGKAE